MTKTPFMISKTSYTIRLGVDPTTQAYQKPQARMEPQTVCPIRKGPIAKEQEIRMIEVPVIRTVER